MNEILWQILEKSNVKTILNLRVINKSFNNYCKKYKKQLIRIIFRQAGYVTINDFSYKELSNVMYKIGVHKLESSLITDYETMKNYETNRQMCINWSNGAHNKLMSFMDNENSFLKNIVNNNFIIEKNTIYKNII
jgi:hypothetical protein